MNTKFRILALAMFGLLFAMPNMSNAQLNKALSKVFKKKDNDKKSR